MTRAEAVNWLTNIVHDIGKSQHRELWHYEQALAEIKKMLEEQPQWIPCSERLPREEEQDDELGVLVTLGNGYSGLQCDWYHGDHWYDWDGFVVAWMPLPTPYREDNK